MPMRCCRLAGALLLLCHLAPSSPAAALPSPACSRHGRTAGCVDTECCAPHGHLKRVSLSRLGTRPAFVPVWPVGRIVDQDRRLGMQFRQPWAVNCARAGGRGVQDQSSPANKQDSDNSVPARTPDNEARSALFDALETGQDWLRVKLETAGGGEPRCKYAIKNTKCRCWREEGATRAAACKVLAARRARRGASFLSALSGGP